MSSANLSIGLQKTVSKNRCVDFRYNPGGPANEAVTLINQFVDPDTTALYLEDKQGISRKSSLKGEKNTESFDDVYILINEGSTSASEVLQAL